MQKLICHFSIGLIEGETEIESIHDAKNGFWINNDYEFTKKSDHKWWIPPSQIEYVERKTVD